MSVFPLPSQNQLLWERSKTLAAINWISVIVNSMTLELHVFIQLAFNNALYYTQIMQWQLLEVKMKQNQYMQKWGLSMFIYSGY